MCFKDKKQATNSDINVPKFKFKHSMADLLNCHCFTGPALTILQKDQRKAISTEQACWECICDQKHHSARSIRSMGSRTLLFSCLALFLESASGHGSQRLNRVFLWCIRLAMLAFYRLSTKWQEGHTPAPASTAPHVRTTGHLEELPILRTEHPEGLPPPPPPWEG